MKPKYKQMSFDTSVRNPDRFIDILKAISKFENMILDDENLLEIVSTLYKEKIVTSNKLDFSKDIKSQVIEINSSRKADGGFPAGYQARFWTYMRTLSELGFVYARYNQKFKFSEVTKAFLKGEIDESEAFSIQTIKHNRKNPYRNVLNDFNFFRFILTILLKKEKLTYEEFIIATFSKNGDIEEFLKLIENNDFSDYEKVYQFLQKEYKVTSKFQTIINDYPDVVIRLFIISGFITIQYKGKKFIELNKNNLNYIKELLKIEFNFSEEEKRDAKLYFKKMDKDFNKFFALIKKYRTPQIKDYTNKLLTLIEEYKISEEIIIKALKNLDRSYKEIEEFREISKPLKFEFFIAILIALKYKDKFEIKPNYKIDHIGKPYSFAPGNMGDIEVFSDNLYWLIEVSLIKNKTQQLNYETTSLIRHLNKVKNKEKYLSFIAPYIHEDTKRFLDYSILIEKIENEKVYIKPYTIEDFINSLDNLLDDTKFYSESFIKNIKEKLCK